MRAWGGGQNVPRPAYPDPMEITQIFDRMRTAIRGTCPFIPLVRSPFRADVTAQLASDGFLPPEAAQNRE
eukprot:4900510-Pyramimonas_sp.AAC.1